MQRVILLVLLVLSGAIITTTGLISIGMTSAASDKISTISILKTTGTESRMAVPLSDQALANFPSFVEALEKADIASADFGKWCAENEFRCKYGTPMLKESYSATIPDVEGSLVLQSLPFSEVVLPDSSSKVNIVTISYQGSYYAIQMAGAQ